VLRGKDVQEIEELKRQGLSIRAISRLTGYDRKTISRYLVHPEGAPVYGPRAKQRANLMFQPYLRERMQAGVWNARVLLRELRERGAEGVAARLRELSSKAGTDGEGYALRTALKAAEANRQRQRSRA